MYKYKTMDANEAVSRVAYNFSELCGIYPITPASPMAEHVDRMSNNKEVNYFGNRVKVVEMQSEAGAIALVHGSLQSGILSTTFTASQGLLLMIPSLYKLAGEMLPGVVHVAARSLSTHSLSIFGDHQDVYACLNTGVCMLASSSVEEAQYMACIAHLSAIKSSLPMIHFFDGFRTSHEINKVKLINFDKVYDLIDQDALNKFRKRAMNSNNPTSRGAAENDDIYFQHTESRNIDYELSVDYISNYMEKINEICDTNIKPFNYYGSKKAETVVVAMGSVAGTIQEVVNYLNSKNYNYGFVNVHLFRPFSIKHLLEVIPKTVKNVVVLDRSKSPAGSGEALYLDVVNALHDKDINVYGGRYGLSSKNTTPKDIKAIFNAVDNGSIHNNFTIGIKDDVTNLSLEVDNNFVLPNNCMEMLIYGYGSDGMVSTSKDLIKIIGDNTDNYVQGYFQYDSKKSGGVTRSHIRVSDKVIKKSYYVDNPSLVVVSKDSYMYKYDILDNVKDNGILILNTNLTDQELYKSIPRKIKFLLKSKNIKFYAIDAYKLVNEIGLNNKISTCMEICIFYILNILDISIIKNIMMASNEKRFRDKGKLVVDANNKIVNVAIDNLREIKVLDEWSDIEYNNLSDLSFEETINSLKGDSLPVSAFVDKKDGVFVGGTTKYEKREIANRVPCWESDACIQCNQCSFVCPHAVIRPFLVEEDGSNVESIPSMMPKGVNYSIGISVKDCTGCGLCYQACPGKSGKKAIKMVDYDKDSDEQDKFDYLLSHNVNDKFKKAFMNVRNEGFIMPKFEFNGSCAGCGETPYLKNLTQVFSNNLFIANATGCSSIYGANVPSMPYSIPWASSLFEDNSEFGLGIMEGVNIKRDFIRKYMENNNDDIFKKWLDNSNDYNTCLEVYNNIDYKKHKELADLKDYITPKSIWIVGGDGFAYDIGYSGLDHVLASGENINILVLDTEVYSNTGGQSSKSSNIGSVASFTTSGKDKYKKDLARIAMCYDNVYVACCNIGYNKEQYLKALMEADKHNGPSLIIAYAPCIEHGIKKGMEFSMNEGDLATKCGYFPIFRYDAALNEFSMDCQDADFSLYDEFLSGENRYAKLKITNSQDADKLLEAQKEWAKKRWDFYRKMDSK